MFATGAVPNAQFDLLVTPNDPLSNGCSETGTSSLNPSIRTSNGRGFIPNTSGPVNRAPGEYQICFYERIPGGGHRTGTNPVFFTVV